MIFTQARRYQIALWTEADRKGRALRLDFDNRDDAERAFAENKARQEYRSGVLFEWQKTEKEWVLLGRYPE